MSGGYELHQKLRTKTVRQLKKKDYDGAIASLSEGARQLLQDKEQGSGCDLACYLVDVYQQASTPSTEESRKRIIDLVALAAPDFWRKKVIDAAVKWSATVTGTPAGDGHLRLALGEIISQGGDYYNAESHFIAAASPPPAMANSDLFPQHAPKSFALMMLEWLKAYGQAAAQQHGTGNAEAYERVGSGHFALRGLLPLLLARSLTSSRAYLSIFMSRLAQRHPTLLLPTQPNPKPYQPPANLPRPSGEALMLYAVANAELSFAQKTLVLASVAVEHKKKTQGSRVPDNLRENWVAAIQQFEKETDEEEWVDSVLPDLSKIYFDIVPQRGGGGGNFMQDMLGSLMGGGPAGASKDGAQPTTVRHAPPPALPTKSEADAGTGNAGAATEAEELDLD